jgi:hypothetical protein
MEHSTLATRRPWGRGALKSSPPGAMKICKPNEWQRRRSWSAAIHVDIGSAKKVLILEVLPVHTAWSVVGEESWSDDKVWVRRLKIAVKRLWPRR